MRTCRAKLSVLPTTTILAAMAIVCVGCLAPQRSDYRTTLSLSTTDDSLLPDKVWESAQEILRQHRFSLDRVDRRAGIITTLPVTSQSLFEFWRHDVNTEHDLWEATLNPLRRWVEFRFSRSDQADGEFQLAVVVNKERLSSPDRQFNSTGAAYQYFGNSLPSTTGLVRVTAEHDKWIDQGRDAAMEEYLLQRIADRAGLHDEATATGK